ncbi:MAG TPA: TrmH family RNA methyltransferase [Polyangiaceae bacterium]
MAVFIHAPQDFRNLCAVARTLDVLGERECHVYDPYRLIRDRYGKARSRMQRDISSGAFDAIRWVRVEEPLSFLRQSSQRLVATVAEAGASCSLAEFGFSPSDLLIFGSESRGLPAELVDLCASSITIPSLGKTQSLNLAVAFGVVLFEWHRQTRASGRPSHLTVK